MFSLAIDKSLIQLIMNTNAKSKISLRVRGKVSFKLHVKTAKSKTKYEGPPVYAFNNFLNT